MKSVNRKIDSDLTYSIWTSLLTQITDPIEVDLKEEIKEPVIDHTWTRVAGRVFTLFLEGTH